MELVRSSWHKIPSSQPNPLHLDPKHGPNLYDVNTCVVKPMTLAAGGQSYALMKHPGGLDCEVFVSHSWHGGIFHLQRGVRLAWPQLYRLQNLYCCLLSNPQNLDLEEFIGGNLNESAFALALRKASYLLVVPNPSMEVYSRLWCVFEAYLGAKWNKIYLLPVVPDRRETYRYWFRTIGCPMFGGVLFGVPVWLGLEHFAAHGMGLYSWLEFTYRLLSLGVLLMLLLFWHRPRSLDVMRCLTCLGSVFLLPDMLWAYQLSNAGTGDSWVEIFSQYGWCSNLTFINALVSVLLVILKREKAHFEQQKEMMHFHSLADSHCSSSDDEHRIRKAIKGSEDDVETVIGILLAAGAYTDSLRHAWDNGLDIERAGMTDVKTGVFFSVLAWAVCALDLLADTFIGHLVYHKYFVLLCILYILTVFIIPFSVWSLEKQGPDFAVFALKTWGLCGMFSLQLPILLCYLQGYDEASSLPLLSFFNRSYLATVDLESWTASGGLSNRISGTVFYTRFLCMIFAWAIVWTGLARWNRLRIWFNGSVCPEGPLLSSLPDADSDSKCSDSSDEVT